MAKTKIAWAEKVWNPTTGCTKVSQGCRYCYAERMAQRTWATQYPPNEDGSPRKFTDIRMHPERMDQPYHWKKPSLIFVDSMSDLFHPAVTEDFIWRVWIMMKACPQHKFLILTKRPERMREMLTRNVDEWGILANVWLGVSAEDQQTLSDRNWQLLHTPASVRFLSLEPLLSKVDFDCLSNNIGGIVTLSYNPLSGNAHHWGVHDHPVDVPKIDWVIVGGESGIGHRPFNVEWARKVRDQCKEANVPFFMKQLGGHPYKNDNLLDFPEDLRIREYPPTESNTTRQETML